MRSSALAMVAAVVLAHAGVAAGQAAPSDEPSDEPSEPAGGPATPADDASPGPDREVPARASSGTASARTGGTMVVVGLELGVGGVLAGGSEVHGAGLGRGFMIGARRGRASIEWHLGGLYDAPIDEELEAANTAGELAMSSLGVRIAPSRSFSLYGGMARASVPLLVREPDGSVRGATLDGIGPIAGVEVGWSTGALRIGVELRLARMLITDATPEHLTVTGPADGGGMIPVTADRSSLTPLLGTLNATIQLAE